MIQSSVLAKSRDKWISAQFLLLLFASFGWSADSGTPLTKTLTYTLIGIISLKLGLTDGVSFDRMSSLLKCLILSVLFIVLARYHNRPEDYSNVLKLVLVASVVVTVSGAELYRAFLNTFSVIYVSSIIGWVFSVFGLGLLIPDFLATQERRMYFLTLSGAVYSDGQNLRAHGPFWEPGVLALYANLVMLAELFCEKKSIKNCWSQLSLVLISGSVGGYISATYVMFSSRFLKSASTQIIFSIVIFFVGLFVYYYFYDLLELVGRGLNELTVALFDRDLTQDDSYISRALDLYVPFIAASDSPYFGWPTFQAFYYFSESLAGFSSQIISNSFGLIAYFYGYPFFLVYIFLLVYGMGHFTKSIPPMAAFVVAPMLVVEPVQFSMLFLLISVNSTQWNPQK